MKQQSHSSFHGTIQKRKVFTTMELDEALMILTEIATGDKERDAICLVKESLYGMEQEAEAYRHLYEGIQKRLALYRDVAAKPDLHENTLANISSETERMKK